MGRGWRGTTITQPLHDAGLVDEVSILSNIINTPANGGHQVCGGAALTATRPGQGTAITVSDSADQVYASACPALPFRSLQLGLRASSLSGTSQGYLNAYSTTQSFANRTPLPVQVNPQRVFDKLFGAAQAGSEVAFARRKGYDLSVLDFAADDLARVKARLGSCDQQRLDQYLTGLRELETRIEATQYDAGRCAAGARPQAVNANLDHEAAVDLMHDLIVKAFECDLTRAISFMRWGAGASDGNLSYAHVTNVVTGQPISMQYHQASHYGHVGNENQILMDVCASIERWEVMMFSRLVNKLRAVREGEVSLLDNCAVLHYASMDTSQYHRADAGLPLILAGRLGGTLDPGRHVAFAQGTEVGDLHLSLLRKCGVDIDTFGETGTTVLAGL